MKARLPIFLGLLAAPRAVLHDLDLLGPVSTALFVFVPLVVWVVAAVAVAPRPFVTLLAAGAVYGVCLAVVHNIFWNASDVRLGGNLAGEIPVAAEQVLLRGATTVGSVVTGLAVGAVCGAIAWALRRVPGTVPGSRR